MNMTNKKQHHLIIQKIIATPGYTCRYRRSGHIQAVNIATNRKVTISGSPADHRAYRNMLRDLRVELGWTPDLARNIRQAERNRRIQRHNRQIAPSTKGINAQAPPPEHLTEGRRT